ncbi:hypothetical protein B9Z55_023290 [Caenorhabditis nigoni]|uniref:Phospholipase A2 domain-containing protein n=1 Tax=Caenorhabditis nigoni TaxID=1611254 RepID=A0A2G5SPR5_9PELO|nr:hypothetical protein B9Z55_023290 [Caenorhabditis nigoni]
MRIGLLLLLTHCTIAAEWHCGSGRVSTAIAWTLSLPATDREYINTCCKAHDEQYDRIQNGTSLLTTQESDLLFSRCLQSSSYRQNWKKGRHWQSNLKSSSTTTNPILWMLPKTTQPV